MTEQHYLIVLDALAGKLKKEVEENKFLTLRVKLLEQKLKDAEKTLN